MTEAAGPEAAEPEAAQPDAVVSEGAPPEAAPTDVLPDQPETPVTEPTTAPEEPVESVPAQDVPVPGPVAPTAVPSPAGLGQRPAPPAGPASFGRVDPDGTVFVRTADGERSVGQVPGVPTEEALAFFTRRFSALELEVSLLERRVTSGALSPDDAAGSVKTVRNAVDGAHAVGDLDGLLTRLDALAPRVAEQRAARRAEKAKASDEAKSAKEAFVLEAEKLAAGNDWRGGVNRFRALLDQWKTLPRLDRATDDQLWHRFSSARTTYTRRRKAQFAQQNEQRESARSVKERLADEAEALAGSTDWGPTTGVYRDLMQQWKDAGPAPRGVDETLWRRFRGAQDTFFAAKTAAMSEQDAEFRVNAEAKEALLAEAEAGLPVTDPATGRAMYRDLLERWSALGKVPRDSIRPLEQRLRTIEEAVGNAEEDLWRRTNPEARARAEDTAAKLEAQIAQLEERAAKAEARGDSKGAAEATASAATYREWLASARKAAEDFSG